jgi:hypothetical protein
MLPSLCSLHRAWPVCSQIPVGGGVRRVERDQGRMYALPEATSKGKGPRRQVALVPADVSASHPGSERQMLYGIRSLAMGSHEYQDGGQSRRGPEANLPIILC